MKKDYINSDNSEFLDENNKNIIISSKDSRRIIKVALNFILITISYLYVTTMHTNN